MQVPVLSARGKEISSKTCHFTQSLLDCVSDEGWGGVGGSSLVELDSLVARVVLLSCFSGTFFVTLFLTIVETLNTRCHNAHPNVSSFWWSFFGRI